MSRRVDALRARRVHVAADGDDVAVATCTRRRQCRRARVHGHDVAVADDELAARRQADRGRGPAGRRLRPQERRRSRRRAERRQGAHEAAPAQIAHPKPPSFVRSSRPSCMAASTGGLSLSRGLAPLPDACKISPAREAHEEQLDVDHHVTRGAAAHPGRMRGPAGAAIHRGEAVDTRGDRAGGSPTWCAGRSTSASTASATANSGRRATSPTTAAISPASRRGRSSPARPARPATTRASATSSAVLQGHRPAGTMFFVPGEKPMPPERERMIASGPVKAKGTAAIARSSGRSRRRSRGRAGGGRDVLLRDRAGLARSLHLQRILQDRRGVHVRAGRGAARGILRGRRTPASSCRSTIPAWSTGGT